MKRFSLVVLFLVGLALSPCRAHAATNSEKVTIPGTVRVASVDLAADDYAVTWSGAGPEVQVTFAKGKKVMATVPAKLTVQTNKQEGVEISGAGGVRALKTINFKNATLSFDASTSASN